MRVKALIAGLEQIVKELGLEGWFEFRTPDRTRIDFAITKGSRRLLAVEFERSRKWLFARVLYNAVKAQRAEFPAILFVYPFYDLPRAGRSWVPNYVEDTLGLRLALCHPRDCFSVTRALINEQLNFPVASNIVEANCVITTSSSNSESQPSSLKLGANAWKRPSSSLPIKKQKKRRPIKFKAKSKSKTKN